MVLIFQNINKNEADGPHSCPSIFLEMTRLKNVNTVITRKLQNRKTTLRQNRSAFDVVTK